MQHHDHATRKRDEDIFPPPGESIHPPPGQRLGQTGGKRPSQPGMVRAGAGNSVTFKMHSHPTHHSFDFREFRHRLIWGYICAS